MALAADLAVAGVTLRALTPGHDEPVRVVMLLQVVLVGGYLVSIALRTLLRDRNVTLFEVTQTALALVVGFGGAIILTRTTVTLPVLMGVASILFGAACYVLAFWFVGRHEGHERNVQFYAALALVLVLAGLGLDLSAQWLAVVSAAFAVVAVAGWARFGRLYLLLHAVVYLLVSSIASHALEYVGQIVAGYSLETSGNLGGQLSSAGAIQGNSLAMGGAVRFTDRPTVTYTPLTGDKFVKALMTPLPPQSVFSTIESGWPADAMLFATVSRLNGLRNQEVSPAGFTHAEPRFLRALELMARIQSAGAVSLRIELDEQKHLTTLIAIRSKDISQETLAEGRELRQLLGLSPEGRLLPGVAYRR